MRLFAICVWVCILVLGGASFSRGEEEGNAIHGGEWAFGESGSREDAIWKKGMAPRDISRRAIPRELQEKGTAVDTSAGINRALDEAKKGKVRGSVGMTMDHQSSTWKARPETMRPDEFMPRDRRHILRAFADVQPTEDLDISVGPELILRDESKGEETAHENQPDSSLGVGMRFKLDF